MFALITVKTFRFSLVLVKKSNIDFQSNEIIDKSEIIELEFNPNSMIILKKKCKEFTPVSRVNENDEVIIKGENYIILHKLKY